MNKLCGLLGAIALMTFSSCQKSQTEEERNAEIDRRVEKRLADENQAKQQTELEQRASDLEAREKALAEKESAVSSTDDQTSRPSTSTRGPSRGGDAREEDGSAASYSTFYTKLDRYGAWRETSDYGYVWQPDNAQRSRNWRPYTDGRWVYTDLGWMWISEEPFGWATYHYGRWARLRHIGWVWVPDDEWAPAWVSWRKSDNYVGWAPLPPEARFDRHSGIRNWADNYYEIGPDQYCFVPTAQFGAQRVSHTIVPPEQNVTIVNQTTNVTNITYNNTTVVNQGPDYYELRKHTQQPIEHLRVEKRTVASPEEENSRSIVRGEVIEIATPQLGKRQPQERPRRIKETLSQTTVDRGWHEVPDSQDAQKARSRISSESTPPPDAPSKTFLKRIETPADGSNPATRSTSPPTISPQAPKPIEQVPNGTTPRGLEKRPDRRDHPSPTISPSPTSTIIETPSPTPTSTPVGINMPPPTPGRAFSPGQRPKDSATPAIQPRDRKEKKEDKMERKREKRERAKADETVSPTLTPAPVNASVSTPNPTSSPGESPKGSATPSVQPRDRKEKKKEDKMERKREKKERAMGDESPSPTPTPVL